MYQPPHFREDRIEVQHALIRAQSLGLLITTGRDGLQANPVPFLIDAGGSERGTLRAHLARANPQWQELATLAECLVVFRDRISTSARRSTRQSTSTARSCRRGTTLPFMPGANRG